MKPTQKTRKSMKPPECIWSVAGVIGTKPCKKDFDCASCRFDRVLRREAEKNRRLFAAGRRPTGRRGRIVSWQENLLRLSPAKRPCIHYLKGRIDFRNCGQEYRCGSCEFDQFFEDQFTVHVAVKPVAVADVQGFQIPRGVYLHRGHAWAKIEEGASVRVGLDDFAFRLFGPADRIESPLVGKPVTQNRPGLRFLRGDRKAEVLSPVGGVVTAINAGLREDAAFARRNPYTDGWVMRVHAPELRKELKDLMIGEETASFMQQEIDALFRMIEESGGPLTADGGDIAADVYGNMPGLGWDRLVKTFLRVDPE
jgi:glycine cleavage system H lipoate-binding protein